MSTVGEFPWNWICVYQIYVLKEKKESSSCAYMPSKLHMLLIAVVFIVAIKPHYFRWQVPRETILILFPKNLKVAISSASGNIEILGKQNSLVLFAIAHKEKLVFKFMKENINKWSTFLGNIIVKVVSLW